DGVPAAVPYVQVAEPFTGPLNFCDPVTVIETVVPLGARASACADSAAELRWRAGRGTVRAGCRAVHGSAEFLRSGDGHRDGGALGSACERMCGFRRRAPMACRPRYRTCRLPSRSRVR